MNVSTDPNEQMTQMYNFINQGLTNPSILIGVVVLVFLFIALSFTLGKGSSNNSSNNNISSYSSSEPSSSSSESVFNVSSMEEEPYTSNEGNSIEDNYSPSSYEGQGGGKKRNHNYFLSPKMRKMYNKKGGEEGSLEGSEERKDGLFGKLNSIKIMMVGILFIAILLSFSVLKKGSNWLGTNIEAKVQGWLKGTPEVDIQVSPPVSSSPNGVGTFPDTGNMATPIQEITTKKQVFNVPGNLYGYNDAQALCSAYGSRLATYDEVETAYDKGGEWCNYGWSDGQMALFPTQKKTYDHLQTIQGHEHDCGRPGINGGYIANPLIKFGVNCFGYKPKINQEEQQLMNQDEIYPKTNKDIAMEKRVDYWKSQIDNIDVSPFNHDTWSKV